jgi:glycosyltransferase involved in cell wall biosynthesis
MGGADVNQALISVIIPHLNQVEGLEACLTSLETQTLERSLFEIIVVDNDSSPRPEVVISRHPGVRLLYEGKPGPGPARNLGARTTTAPVLCFIDADCRAHTDWLTVALASLASSPEGTILGGDVQIWRENQAKYTAIEVYESIFAYRQRLHIERHRYSGTGNLAVRRADFEKIGPFGGILLPEDREWGDRANAAGFTFKYIQKMIVFHPPQPSFKRLRIQWDRETRHALTRARGRSSNWRIYWIARALIIFFSPLVHGFWIITAKGIDPFSRIKGLAVLVAIRSFRAWRMLTLLASSRNGVLWNRDATVGADDAG